MRDRTSELLDVARIETGTLPVVPEPAEVAVLLDEARNVFLSGGGRENVVMNLKPDLPRVLADGRLIVQALGNLLTNAARHSHESPTRAGGFPPERLPLLFRKFSRIDGEGEREVPGSGLGLAICRGIIEAHGGRIWAESEGTGLGTRFTFTLPAARPANRRASRPVPGGRRRSGSGSWRWTTTPRRCGTCGTPWSRRASNPW